MAVLAGFAILGAWRGLLRTLAGLLVLALSLAGAVVVVGSVVLYNVILARQTPAEQSSSR